MNLDEAIQAHAHWKVKFRSAIASGEQMDVVKISADNCCPLGMWLHGDARKLYGTVPAYSDLVTKHAAFHREAGRVAEAINAKRMSEAEAMLLPGTPYADVSSTVTSAIAILKRITQSGTG